MLNTTHEKKTSIRRSVSSVLSPSYVRVSSQDHKYSTAIAPKNCGHRRTLSRPSVIHKTHNTKNDHLIRTHSITLNIYLENVLI